MHVLRQVDCGVEQNMSLYNQKGAKGGFLYLELSNLPFRVYYRGAAPEAEMHQTRNAEDPIDPYQSQDIDYL